MRKLLLAALLLLFAAAVVRPAEAQSNTMCWVAATGQWVPCSTSNPLAVAGTVTVNNLVSPNNIATITRPANTSAYTGGQLIANNTGGSVTPTQIVITASAAGTAFIVGAYEQSTNTGGTAPGEHDWYLFNAAPTVTSLVDGSAYIAPFAADIGGGKYIGKLICNAWVKTNDATAQWYTPCSTSGLVQQELLAQALSGQLYIDTLLETVGAYTPISGEVETLVLSTAPNK